MRFQSFHFNISTLLKSKTSLEGNFCHKLAVFFVTECGRPEIFQTMNSVRSKNPSLKIRDLHHQVSNCTAVGINFGV